MRADRLIATLLLMQTRGKITAAELAKELEISLATARRDLEALSAAGVPVYPQTGRGGGWSLLGGARTDLSGLTAAEAKSLFLLLGPAVAISPDAKTALRKLLRALPQTFQDEAEAAAKAIFVDTARWGERQKKRPAMVNLLETAVIRQRKVNLTYDGRSRGESQRIVDPWGLIDKDDLWYLIAGTDKGQRTFRADRILHIEMTELPTERPSDFDLANAWTRIVEEVERQRAMTATTIRIDEKYLAVLQDRFGRHCETIEVNTTDGCARVRLTAPTPLDLARHLAGWGALIHVESPETVQRELAKLGAELATAYAHLSP
ncbi:MAG: WYL domain-containing protein [Corynebacteriales bacterium]|nr:WYL domain-containing protein [Mycobacteriales bacterium]